VAGDEQAYQDFRRLLGTPGAGDRPGLFDAFFRVAPGLLGIRLRVIMPDGEEETYGPEGGPALFLVRTSYYMPALRPPAVAYLAMRWLTTDYSRPVPATDSLPRKGQDQAAELARWPVPDQAWSVRETLQRHRLYLTIDEPTDALPPGLEPGTRIWLATSEGLTFGVWLAPDGQYHRFDPRDGTVSRLGEAEFARWVRDLPDRPLTLVVARPTMNRPVSAGDLRRAVNVFWDDENGGAGPGAQTLAGCVTMVGHFARMLYPKGPGSRPGRCRLARGRGSG
jgi:hypothetical protein